MNKTSINNRKESHKIMHLKKLLSILLSLIFILSSIPICFADDAPNVASVKVDLRAQLDNSYLCAPQYNISVASNAAETYGLSDSVDGVSVLDALVVLHELVFGKDELAESIDAYLAVNSYGGLSTSFGISSDMRFAGFTLNGLYAHSGVEYAPGEYIGTMETTQKLKNGDSVDFFFYCSDWSNKLSWFTKNSVTETSFAAAPSSNVTLALKSIPFSDGCKYKEATALYAAGQAYAGAQLAYVDTENGTLTDITGAVTAEDGSVSFATPSTIGTYYICAYKLNAAEENELIMPFAKLEVREADPTPAAPHFESFELSKTAFVEGTWVTDSTYEPTKLSYELPIKNASTSSITVMSSTVYDTNKYTAVAEYTDVNGEKKTVALPSATMTMLKDQPFDSSVLKVTISDKADDTIKTVYTFNVTRPRETTKKIKSNGITLTPSDRKLSSSLYNGIGEGVMQQCDENGEATSKTGVVSSVYDYRAFVYSDVEAVDLTFNASTNYAHLRYSLDGGNSWSESASKKIEAEDIALLTNETKVLLQIMDDATYTENIRGDREGFDTSAALYSLVIYKVSAPTAKITSAEADGASFYPTFDPEKLTYVLMVKNDAEAPVLKFKVADNCKVTVGKDALVCDEDGTYTLTLSISKKTVTVTSADNSYTSSYQFSYSKSSALDVPDKVVDYLCIGSQYTNNNNGKNPENVLKGSLSSLGNFGGYITFYYEDPIVNDPKNKYGLDFYVIGNSSESNIDSMAELGQVYVSEDGKKWYALAGSEHYEDKAIWDYTITYTRTNDGKATWSDNYGNSIDYSAQAWPSAEYYYMNDVAEKDSYTFSGILFKGQSGSIVGDSTSTANFAASASFGYTDYYASNISGKVLNDVNSYVASPSKANGFDLAWAVDESGLPIDVSGKAFHYIKVATASNLWAGSYKEKSTEVTYVVRTSAQESAVGKTTAPTGVTITDGTEVKRVSFKEGERVYSVDLGSMKYVSIKVDSTADDDNIYINAQRVESGEYADGFKVTHEKGEVIVRVIVQNGDKEPVIYHLKLKSDAEESDETIEGIKLNAGGIVREAKTLDGLTYTASVGHRISSVSLGAIAADNVDVKINGEAVRESYSLSYGENIFTVVGTDGERTHEITLKITRENAPEPSDTRISVSFALYGDTKHGDDIVHVYNKDHSILPIWIRSRKYTVDANATVLDVFETALDAAELSYKNDGGNYISEINGLAEVDNGENSGWMYTLNGKYTTLGISEQKLENGDVIVFHYTDDYTLEDDFSYFESTNTGNYVDYEFSVKFVTSGGSRVDSQSIKKNGRVEKPSEPTKEGYEFAGWFTDKELTSEYDFNARVTKSLVLYAKWVESSPKLDEELDTDEVFECLFVDVENDAWYFEAIEFVVDTGLFTGISKTEFAPEKTMTRAMLVTVLHRLSDEKEAVTELDFADIEKDAWYADAVAWAYENGIVNGISETEFAPDAELTREQLATILYRYAEHLGLDTEKRAELSRFEDIEELGAWAYDAVAWAVEAGVINGTSDTTLAPASSATRAQVATILMRFCETVFM